MGATIIRSPTADDYIMVSGYLAYLTFGSRKRFKVLLQDSPEFLLDFRTGVRIPSRLGEPDILMQEATYIMVTQSPTHKYDPITCAQYRLTALVEALGEERLFSVLDATPTLNTDDDIVGTNPKG